MSTTITCFSADPEYFNKIIELGSSHYSKNHHLLDKNYLNWFYCLNPNGKAKLVVAHESGVWIGLVVLIPILLTANSIDQQAYYAVNVLSHPDHRNKNLFIKMIQHAKEMLEEKGHWLIGHPNQNAVPGWKRKKMQFRGNLYPHLIKPSLSSFKCKKLRITNTKQLRDIPTEFWDSMNTQSDVFVRASVEYLAWRYLEAPHKKYKMVAIMKDNQLLGLRVTRRFKGPVGLLVDYLSIVDNSPTVITSIMQPCLLLHSGSINHKNITDGIAWKLPVDKIFPFFVTTWQNSDNFEMSGITLSASDF